MSFFAELSQPEQGSVDITEPEGKTQKNIPSPEFANSQDKEEDAKEDAIEVTKPVKTQRQKFLESLNPKDT